MANEFKYCRNCKREVANYVLHSLHCERNIQLCKLCNEPVPKSERDQHVKEYHSVEACKLCNTRMETWQMAKHEEVCIKRLVDCNICKLQLPLDELEEHNDVCGARTEKCPLCNEYVMLKNLDRHRETCQSQVTSKSQGKCSYCHEIIAWIDMREHESYCQFSTYQSDDEDISKSNVDHMHPKTQEKCWQSDSRQQKRTGDSSTIHKMKQCEYCKERFPDLIIATHLETCKEGPYRCELCWQTFPLKDKRKHEESICPMISGNDNCYAASGYTKSYEKKLKSCPYCGKKFPELMFKDHQDICDKSPYQCNLCLKAMPLEDKTNHDTKECKFMDKKRNPYLNKLDSQRGYSIDATGYQRSYEKNLKCCPYCEKNYPDTIISEHLEACNKRAYKCSLCEKFVTLKNKSYHDKFECQSMDKMHKQYSDPDGVYSRDVASVRSYSKDSHAYLAQYEKKLKDCPFCEEKYPESIFIEHLEACDKRTYSDRVYSRDVTSIRDYSKDAQDASGHFEKDSLEFNHKSCPYCNSKIVAQRIAEHVQLCSENKTLCRFCGTEVLRSEETLHLQTCIGARHVVEEPVYQAPDEKEFQISGSKKNKRNKRRPQNQSEPPTEKTSFLSMFTSWKKESNPQKNGISPIPQTIAPQFPQVVLLPCEFCDELFPADVIIDHQSGCRPDLTSLPQTEASQHTKLQFSNIHDAYHDRNTKLEAQLDTNAYKDVKNTGAKPKHYQNSRNGVNVAPGEFLPKRISPTKEPDCGPDYFHYPSGFPDNSNQVEGNASKQNKKLHHVQDEEKDNQTVPKPETQKMSVKNTKMSIFNFSASSNDFRNRNSANQATSPLPRVSKYDFHKDKFNSFYNSTRQGFSDDENPEMKAVGAERAEKKGIIQISRDTSMNSHGVYSEVAVIHDESSQDSDAVVSNEVYVEHDTKNQLSSPIQLSTTPQNSDKKYKNNYSEEMLNICFGEETSKIIESEKTKTTCATRLLSRLENLDLHEKAKTQWENDCTEEDAKNAETFGNNTDFDDKFDVTQAEDNLSDSGEHFFDAEDDFKSIEANDSTSSSPKMDSDLDVYFQFLRKGRDEVIENNDMKNERLPEVESASVCECGNEICYCAIINQPDSVENNNYLQERTDNLKEAFAKGATPSVCLQEDLDTYYAFRSANSQCGRRNIVGNEGQVNGLSAEVEKRSSTWNEWRHAKRVETDSD